jgi:hypothetical protein
MSVKPLFVETHVDRNNGNRVLEKVELIFLNGDIPAGIKYHKENGLRTKDPEYPMEMARLLTKYGAFIYYDI